MFTRLLRAYCMLKRLHFVFWQPPEQVQSSIQGRLALRHLQRAPEHPLLLPHSSNSRQPFDASGRVVHTGAQRLLLFIQPMLEGSGSFC